MIEMIALALSVAFVGVVVSTLAWLDSRAARNWWRKHLNWRANARFEARANADAFARDLFSNPEDTCRRTQL